MAGDPRVLQAILRAARKRGASPVELKALVEAGITESGLRPLTSGDRDSTGFLQQRPSQGWGPVGQSPQIDAEQFLAAARKVKHPGISAGGLAQAVQRSAFPGRYAQHAGEADAILRRLGAKGAQGIGAMGSAPGALFSQGSTEQHMQTTVDQAGFEKARRAAIVGELIAKHRGTNSVLFKTGLLTTAAPNPADFTTSKMVTTHTPGSVVSGSSAQPGAGSPSRKALRPGMGWAGTEGLAQHAIFQAADMGWKPSSEKRATKTTATGGISDHWTGNKRAFAVDLANGSQTENAQGMRLARRIAQRYGVKFVANSYASGGVITAQGHQYRIQILYGNAVKHGDHVHVGIERVS